MRKIFAITLLSGLSCFGQVVLPEGTKIRVRLEQSISSATAEEGQHVELCVTDAVKVGDTTVIAEGAHVTGTVTQAHEKRRMGRAGKLDFSIDRVKTVDNQWVPVRYTVTRKSGQSHALSTGILTAGTAAVFWPAAPVFLLRKGQDITMNRDVSFEVYTDRNYTVNVAAPPATNSATAPAGSPVLTGPPGSNATVSITSSIAAAEIEVDGVFVGNTPTTIQLAGGQYIIAVKRGEKSWQRTLQVSGGSTITLNATLQ
jgi:hypothetical protein